MDINKFLSKLFGNKSTRDMRLIQPLVEKVKKAYPEIQALSNDELRAKTQEIKKYVQSYADDLKAKLTKHRDGSFSILVTSSLKKLGNTVSIAPLQKRDMLMEWKGRAEFKGLAADELSEFYIISALSEEGTLHEAIIRIITEGMPNERDTAIYKSIIKNRHDFVRFLELMLSDTPVQYLSNEIILKEKSFKLLELK